MTAMPWSKFFWDDWEADPGLRLCSLAAQGLWMRLLCICAKSDPKGYLTINNHPLAVEDIARLAGVTQTEVETLMAELDRHGVFSRDRKGRIYSRRMVRDEKKAKTARKNGKTGGNPTLGKQRVNSASVKGQDKGGDKPQKPEARIQTHPLPFSGRDDGRSDRSRSVEEIRTAVWRGSGLTDQDVATKRASANPEGLRQVMHWLDQGLTVDTILTIIERAFTDAHSRGEPIRRPWPYLDIAMQQAAEQTQQEDRELTDMDPVRRKIFEEELARIKAAGRKKEPSR